MHLRKNQVDFEQVRDSKYLHAKVKIIEDEEGRKRIRSTSADRRKQNMFERNANKGHLYHNDCVYGKWEHTKMMNNQKLEQDLERRLNNKPKYDKHGNRVMTFEEIRDMLRCEPNQKKSIPKFLRNGKLSKEVFPNEDILQHQEEGIFYEDDIMNKDFYYAHLAERLGYGRVYNFNAVNQSLNEYTQADKNNLNNKRSRLNIVDSALNAESLNFERLDKLIEKDAKNTDKTKNKIMSKIIDRKDEMRVKAQLKGENGGMLGVVDEKVVLRKQQEHARKMLDNLKRKGMVGELTRIFLMGDNMEEALDYDLDEVGEEDDEENEEDFDPELIDALDRQFERDDDMDDDEFERLKAEYLQKLHNKREKESPARSTSSKGGNRSRAGKSTTGQKGAGTKKKPSGTTSGAHDENIFNGTKTGGRTTAERGDRDDLELSSIKSDTSDFIPNRREVLGHKVLNGSGVHPTPPNRQDSKLMFEQNGDDQSGKPSEKSGNGLQKKPTDNDKFSGLNSPTGKDSLLVPPLRQGTRNSADKDNRSGSAGDSGEGKSQNSRQSVLGVQKRDKTNMMENLVRIHMQRQEDEKMALDEADDYDDDHKGIDFNKRIGDLKAGKGKRKFRVPGERIEERLKNRKKRDNGLDKWGVTSVPRKKKYVTMKQLYRFKNTVPEEDRTKLTGVNLELLHTDELMAYYRELVAKGNRDLTVHQRLQNEIKRLEYESVASASRSKSKRKRGSPSRGRSGSKGIPKVKISKPNEEPVQTMIVTEAAAKKQAMKRKKPKSRSPPKMRKTIAF